MKCRLFNIFAAISLLLCMATVTVWVRSYFYFDIMSWNKRNLDFQHIETGPLFSSTFEIGSVSGLMKIESEYAEFERGLGWAGAIGAMKNFEWVAGKLEYRGHFATAIPRYGQPPYFSYSAMGFGLVLLRSPESKYISLRFPAWSSVLVTSFLPLWWLTRHMKSRRRQARVAQGCCYKCAYDLRASPERCPECGAC